MSKTNELELIKGQIQQVNKQGEYLLKIVDEVKETRDEIKQIEQRANERLEDLENTKTLQHGEAKKIKSKVSERAYTLTHHFFTTNISDELFHKKRIHLLIGIYKALNEYFDAITYTTIRHIDYDKAMQYINEIELLDLPLNYLKLTDKQKEVAEKNQDKVITLFSTNNRKSS